MADLSTMSPISPGQIAVKIGQKLERVRLSRNITQSDLARSAGVSVRTLRRLESGEGVTLDTLIRVLTSLQLQENLKLLLPDPRIRPIERVRTAGRERERASSKQTKKKTAKWEWGAKD